MILVKWGNALQEMGLGVHGLLSRGQFCFSGKSRQVRNRTAQAIPALPWASQHSWVSPPQSHHLPLPLLFHVSVNRPRKDAVPTLCPSWQFLPVGGGWRFHAPSPKAAASLAGRIPMPLRRPIDPFGTLHWVLIVKFFYLNFLFYCLPPGGSFTKLFTSLLLTFFFHFLPHCFR